MIIGAIFITFESNRERRLEDLLQNKTIFPYSTLIKDRTTIYTVTIPDELHRILKMPREDINWRTIEK